MEATVAAPATERLGPLDSAFLYGETAGHPLHIGAVCVFDAGPLTASDGALLYEDLCRLVESRIHRVPRLRQRVVAVPLDMGRPVWADDTDFDVRHHMRRTALPSPGSWDQLLDLAGRLQARPLDRARPLWEFWFVENVCGRRIALVPKIHHSLGDGVSLVDLALLLLDPSDAVPEEDPEPRSWQPVPAPSGMQRVWDAVVDSARVAGDAARGAVQRVRTPAATLEDGTALVRTLRSALHFTAPIGIKGKVGPRRQLRTLSVPLERVGRVRRAHGSTLNDVVLCAAANGLREQLGVPGLPARNRNPRAVVPVSMRSTDDHGHGLLGNRVSLMLPELAVHVADPVERLALVSAEMTARKAESEARHTGSVLDVARYLPPAGLRAASRGVMRTQPFASILVTNVPGPAFPLYLRGSRMHELYPYLGPLGGMGLVVAVASYDGNLTITVTADPDLAGDVSAFAEGMEKGMHALASV